jgi:hypothetical protein
MLYLSRLLQADRVLSAVVAPYGGCAQTPFQDAYNAKKASKTADSSSDGRSQDVRGDTDAVACPPLCTKLRPGRATNDEAFDLGVLCADGTGDGIGLSLAGGAEAVKALVAKDIQLSPADVVFIARHILGALAADALKKQATDLGLAPTKGGRKREGGKADGAAVAFGGEWWFCVHTHTHSIKALLRLY